MRVRRRPGSPPVPRLLLRFGLLSAFLIVNLGASAGVVLRDSIKRRTNADAVRTAEVLTSAGIRPFVSPLDLTKDFVPLDSDRIAVLDRTIGRSLSANGIVRLKVWNRQHWLVYSDKQSLRGRWFPADENLSAAFAGRTTSQVTDLSKPEEMEERDFGRLLSVYVPLRVDAQGEFTGDAKAKVVGAFEVYLPYNPIASAIWADTKVLYKTLAIGGVVLFLGLFRLMQSASRRLRVQVADNRHQALHDSLTGLANRALLRDRIDQAIEQAKRSGTVSSVLLLDVDRFKELNDAFGHVRGDQLLIAIAERLVSRVRSSDSIARLGGDEFALMVSGLANSADATIVADDIQRALAEPFDIDGIQVDVRVSIGIASAPDNGDDADTLLRHADVAMYAAKHSHTEIEVYRVEVDHYRPERLSLVSDFRRAMDAGELVLYFQPKLDLKTNRVFGCEALIRWAHPTRGILPPGMFMPMVETTELIKPLTVQLIDQAMRFAHDMRAIGHELSVAVNLSARSTVDLRLPDQVSEILAKYRLPASTLELELTESAVLDNPMRAKAVLESVAELGVPISVDDFGTGYASISYLTELPIATLKIDRSFAHDVITNPKSEAVVSFSVALAANLGLKVVAEGIEDIPTLQALRRLGCDQIQGYVVCRPIPGFELRQVLDDWDTRSKLFLPTMEHSL